MEPFSRCPCSRVGSALPAVQEADGAAEEGVDLGCALERQQRDRQREPLPGDRLRPGDLAQPVLTVDAPEAAVAGPAERQARHTREGDDLVDAGHTGTQSAGELDAVLLAEDGSG